MLTTNFQTITVKLDTYRQVSWGNDPGLQAAISAVRTDKGPGGMRNDFEACVSHIVPYCLVSKKRTTGTKLVAA